MERNRQTRIVLDKEKLKRKQRIGVWFTKVEQSSKRKKMDRASKMLEGWDD